MFSLSHQTSIINTMIQCSDLESLLEVALGYLVEQENVNFVKLLCQTRSGQLVHLASAVRNGWQGQPEIYLETWQLDSFYTAKSQRLYLPKSHRALPILLTDGGRDLGLLYLGLGFAPVFPQQLDLFQILAHILSLKLRVILTEKEKMELNHEIDHMIKMNKENIKQLTDISKQLYAITAISTRMNEITDYIGFFSKINAKLAALFGCDAILVYRRYSESKRPTVVFKDLGELKLTYKQISQITHFVANRSQNERCPLIINGTQNETDRENPLKLLPFQTIVVAPLLAKNREHGILVLLHNQSRSYYSDTLRLLSGLTSMLATAVENIDLYNEAKRKQHKVSFLLSSISRFGETLDLAETLKAVVKEASRIAGKSSAVYLLSRGKVPLVMLLRSHETGERLDTYETLEPATLRYLLRYFEITGRSVIVNNLSKTQALPQAICKTLRRLGIRSLMGVPIRLEENPLGVLLLCSLGTVKVYSREDLEVVKGIADAAAIAIKNSQVHSAAQELSYFLERKIIEGARSMEATEIKDKLALEDAQDMVFRMDLEGNLVFINKAMELKTGYPKAMFYQGKVALLDLVSQENRSSFKQAINAILKGQEDRIRDLEINLRQREGERLVVSLHLYADKDAQSRIIGLEGIATDITSKKLLEEEIKRSKELAMLGEFSGSMAHQIRTPLSQMYVGLRRLGEMAGPSSLPLMGSTPETAEVKRVLFEELISGIIHNAKQINQIVSEVLNYTRSLKLCQIEQQVEILLQEALEDFKEEIARQGVLVELKLSPTLPPVRVDAIFLGQALRNIIQNALEAMISGGVLSISGEVYASDPQYVKITITDTGCGIPPAEIEKIFYPFFTTKPQGTGLGLALACKIIEAHKGSIWAESTVGQGTRLSLLLPLAVEAGKNNRKNER